MEITDGSLRGESVRAGAKRTFAERGLDGAETNVSTQTLREQATSSQKTGLYGQHDMTVGETHDQFTPVGRALQDLVRVVKAQRRRQAPVAGAGLERTR